MLISWNADELTQKHAHKEQKDTQGIHAHMTLGNINLILIL